MHIIKIEKVGNRDVYDMEVKGTHCFGLEAGVYVHNSENMDRRTTRFREKGIRVHYDYSQAEVRVMAKASEDENLMNAFYRDADIHRFVACFTGDTRIRLLDRTTPTFLELKNRFDSGETLYTYSVSDSDNLVFSKITNVYESGYVTSLVKVTLDNGDVITCTPEHLFRTREKYIQAKDLKSGTSITPIYFKYYKGYEMSYELSSNSFEFTHKRVTDQYQAGVSFSGMIRHHIDINKKNNNPENLKLMTWKDHQELHRTENPLKYYSKTEENRARMSKIMKERNSDPEFAEKRNEASRCNGREFLKKGGLFQTDSKYEESRKKVKEAGIAIFKHHNERMKTDENYREQINNKMLKSRENNLFWLESVKKHMQEVTRNPEVRCRMNLTRIKNILDRVKLQSYVGFPRETSILRSLVNNINKYAELVKKNPSEILIDKFNEHKEYLESKGILINHKVVSIEEIKLEKPVAVYDLTVDSDCHNFSLALSDDSCIIVHNSRVYNKPEAEISEAERRFSKMAVFSLLYGKTEVGMANDFMQGDVERARKLFSDFFTAFPSIKKFVRDRHREALTTGKVVTIFGDILDVNMPDWALELSDEDKEKLINNAFDKSLRLDRDSAMAVATALRHAQNYPIQSASSSLAAMSIKGLSDYFLEIGSPAKIDCFTHDSSEIDTPICDLYEIMKAIPEIAVKRPRSTYGIPMKVDIDWSIHGDHAIEFGAIEFDDSTKTITAEFEGKKSSFEEVIEQLKRNGVKIEYEITKESNQGVSMKELFITRRAFSLDIGKKLPFIKGNIKCNFSEVVREY